MARASILALLAAVWLPPVAAAQTDYRNLDHGRPSTVEDAYPIEHHALEFQLGYGVERESGVTSHEAIPEITWGVLSNFQIGAGFPLRSIDQGSQRGLAGIEGSALFNILTESVSLPALSIGSAVHLPVGALAGRKTEAELSLVATRSIGKWRAHANGGFGLDGEAGSIPRWRSGFALDRTFYRQSLLLVGGVVLEQSASGSPTRAFGELGLRWQASPTLVLSAGLERRLSAAGPDAGLRIGFSRTIGLPRSRTVGPVGQSHTQRPGLSQRNDEFYAPGNFNWRFLATYPEAARLFNGFDYGHAVLYERLLTRQTGALDREFRYLTRDLLIRPPRLAVAEETIAPNYARYAWRAMQIFDWAHLLHRQIYDILADDRRTPAEQSELIERVTDVYLANRSLALASLPKQMELMDQQYYSQVFRKANPRFNGLIWSYHWLQVALYEPLLADSTAAGRKAGVQAVLARFWRMLEAPERTGPAVMPMTSTIAPELTRQHPRAAAIFDNLHMLHDIVSDILLSGRVPAKQKRAEIYLALDRFQDASREVMPVEHWLMMGEMMGGIDKMGGPATGLQ